MKLLRTILAAATARAALVAKDREHYTKYWARPHENGRCDAKHCEWMRGFGAIDVGCRLQVDRAGLAGGPGPAFSLVLADNETLSIDARDAAAITRFRTRPAWDRCTRRLAVQRWLGATAAASAAAGAAAPAVAAGSYDAPDLNEVSGLVVLRVAQVADFQEKLLREVAKGSDLGVPVTPQQFMFGTELLLQNSNLDGNIKLMIREEVPRDRMDEALKRAPQTMNALLAISGAAARIADAGRFQLTPDDARELADLYRNFRRELLFLFATLPQDAQKRYSGYADALLAYEKDLTRDCKGGAAGGCLTEDDEPAPPAKGSPKAGQAPRDLAKALEAADARGDLESAAAPEAPPAWVPPAAKPARGSFAAMAAGY